MPRHTPTPFIAAIYFLTLPLIVNADEICEFSGADIYVDEDASFILCGDGLPEELNISTADPSVASVVYVQPVGRCDVSDRRAGYHVVLNSQQSGETVLQVTDAASGNSVCSSNLVAQESRKLEEPEWLDAMPLSDAKYIDVKGIQTRYFDRGSGPALILVHGGQAGGANNSAQKWEQNFVELARTFRVIALDRLAQAGTDNIAESDDYANYFALDAQHLVDFIVALELEDVSLAGHSQGGWPVTWATLHHPDLIKCTVNIDTVMVPDDLELMKKALQFIIFTAVYIDPPTGPTVHSARRAMLMRYPSGKNVTHEKLQRVVDQHKSPKTAEARQHMSALRMTPQNPAFKVLRDQAYADIAARKFQARSLVIWGAEDPQVPVGLGQQFNQILLDGSVETEFVAMEGAGHAPFVEFPEEFNKLVIDYCID